MSAFSAYLQRYHLDVRDVALAAGVRLLTVWNIDKGTPVQFAHAAQVRVALLRMTDVPYTAPIVLLDADGENRQRASTRNGDVRTR
jgi:hypothetical protein